MTPTSPNESMRLAKYLAAAGVASRREAERLIESGQVSVNGAIITTPVCFVTGSESIMVAGKSIRPPLTTPRLWLFHKPIEVICSNADPEGRTTIFDLLPQKLPRVVSVGRLDYLSEGLILLTTSGALAGALEHPSSRIARTYKVRAYGTLTEQHLSALAKGMEVEGIRYGPVEVEVESLGAGRNIWLRMTLHEGKNQEIRKLLSACGLQVNRLIRIGYGEFELGKLLPKQCKEAPRGQIETLCRKLRMT